MKAVKCLFTVLLGLIVCISCHDKYEWSEWEPFDIKSSSITLMTNESTASGTVSSEATSIDIATDPEPMIRNLKLNGEDVKLDFYGEPEGDLSENNNLTVASGEWGELGYVKNETEYSIKLDLTKNYSPAPKVIKIHLSGAYRRLDIIITQEGASKS